MLPDVGIALKSIGGALIRCMKLFGVAGWAGIVKHVVIGRISAKKCKTKELDFKS